MFVLILGDYKKDREIFNKLDGFFYERCTTLSVCGWQNSKSIDLKKFDLIILSSVPPVDILEIIKKEGERSFCLFSKNSIDNIETNVSVVSTFQEFESFFQDFEKKFL